MIGAEKNRPEDDPVMRTFHHAAALCVLSLVSASASAQGWFAGGAIGQGAQQEYTIAGPVATFDDADDSYRIFGGYLISPLQGLVVSYIDLGTGYADGPAFGGFTDKMSADGFDISYIIGWSPAAQERVRLFGTVGLFAWDQDVRYVDSLGFFKYKDDGTSFSLGMGVEYRFGSSEANAWGIHGEYQLFKDVGRQANSGHEYDREVLSVGLIYRFGRGFQRP